MAPGRLPELFRTSKPTGGLPARWLMLAVGLLVACDEAADDGSVEVDVGVGVDVGSADAADAADIATCPSETPICDGLLAVSCVDGVPESEDCVGVGYCNFGACAESGIVLPDDAGSHRNLIEWWYYTGHVADGDQAFGFEIALFQQRMADLVGDLFPGDQEFGYMCHVALLDKSAGEHFYTEGLSIEADVWTADPVELQVLGCELEISGDGHDHIVGTIPAGREGRGRAGSWTFDLTMVPTKPVVHHGGDGVIGMGHGGDSYYYSYTRLDAVGTIDTPDGSFAVAGQGWMDHQWGEFSAQDFKGWDWWSMQFEDGWEIMLFLFRSWEGEIVVRAGTLVDPVGNTIALDGIDAFEITGLRTWESVQTDGVYPLDWDIRIAELDWDLQVRTQVDEQEMPNVAKTYWEGAVTIAGTRGAVDVRGVGYVELTGYATNPTDP